MAKRKEAGRAFVTLGTDNNPLAKGLRAGQRMIAGFAAGINATGAAIGKGLQAAGNGVSAVGRRFTLLGATALAALSYPITAASDLQETMSKFEVVFGDQAAAIQQWGDTLADEVGRSKKQIRDFAASNQDLFVPMGIDPAAARDMSKTLTQLAIDLGSFNNKSDAEVHRDLQAAMTGSGETMKKYGVIVSQAAVNQELLNRSIDPKAATEAQKAQARLAIILAGTTAAQGDAARTGGSFANQMKRLRATIDDGAAAIGTKLLPVVTPLISKAVAAVKVVADWAVKNDQLAVVILKVAAGVTAAGIALTALGPIITALGTTVLAGSAALSAVVGVVGTLLGLLPMLLSPIGLVAAGFAAVAVQAGKNVDLAEDAGTAWNGLKNTATTALAGIRAALASGDLETAGQIAFLGLQVAISRALSFLKMKFVSFKIEVLTIFNDLALRVGDSFRDFTTDVADYLVIIQAKLEGVSEEEQFQRFQENRAIGREKKAAAEAAAEKRIADLKKQQIKTGIQDWQERNELQQQLDALVGAAKNQAGGGPVDRPSLERDLGAAGGADLPGTAADVTGNIAGTFSAFGVAGLAAGTAADRTAKATEGTERNTMDLVREIRRKKTVFG